MSFAGKKVAVLGVGVENIPFIHYLIKHDAEVVACDQKTPQEMGEIYQRLKKLPIQFRLGPHYLDHLLDFSIIFRTPGLSIHHPKIQQAFHGGVEVSSQTKLFFEHCPTPIIGVTGTKGKGTTVSLIAHILKQKYSNVWVGGNIGAPPIEFLEEIKPQDFVVLELSSFQLQDLTISPHISVILDVTSDHLDYHLSHDEYIESKKNMVRHQGAGDYAVINADYLTSFEFGAVTRAKVLWFSRRKSVDQGAYINSQKQIVLCLGDKRKVIGSVDDTQLIGEHNWENICAAVVVGALCRVEPPKIRRGIKSFKSLPHRLEKILAINGVTYINDTFSTTPSTAMAAISSFKNPIILIAGGSDKGADYNELGRAISRSSVKTIILIGQMAGKIEKAIKAARSKKIIRGLKSMNQVVRYAHKEAIAGDVVLLSPAAASFDMFNDYKDRGDQFRKAVKNAKLSS